MALASDFMEMHENFSYWAESNNPPISKLPIPHTFHVCPQ